MATTIAEYYTDELTEWSRLIAFYSQELDEYELKLGEVIQRNNIPHIADLVESEQHKLNEAAEKFEGLEVQIELQEAILKTDNTFIDDSLIDTGVEKQQNELRRGMQQAEKEYIEKKHACNNFLSGILKK